MKSEGTNGITIGTAGSLKIYGNTYLASVVKVGRSRVTVRFRMRRTEADIRERTVPVTYYPERFRASNVQVFIPRFACGKYNSMVI